MSTNKMGQMSKLLKFKTWLSVADAAKQLSLMFEEEVTEADVLRFALDGHLKLSINIVNDAKAKFGTVALYSDILDLLDKNHWFYFCLNNIGIEKLMYLMVTDSQPSDVKAALFDSMGLYSDDVQNDDSSDQLTQEEILESFPPLDILFGAELNEDEFFRPNGELTNIDGLWDLKMTGTGRAEIERRYQIITGGVPSAMDTDMAGIIIENEDGDLCQIQSSYKRHQFKPGTMIPTEIIKHHLAMTLIEMKSEKEFLSLYKKKNEKYSEKLNSDLYHYPSGIPDDSMIVVRVSALIDLQNKLYAENSERDKPLGTRERENLLRTIIGMAIGGYGYDVKAKKSDVPQSIVNDLGDVGVSLSVDTIKKYLNYGSEFIIIKGNS